MKHNLLLTVASLLSILFFTLHLAGDIVYGYEPGTTVNLIAVPIAVVWLYGTLVLAERRSGYIIILLASLLSSVVPVVHMQGKGVGVASRMVNTGGHFFFVWTLLALGATGLFGVILSARALWNPQWGRSRSFNNPKMETPAETGRVIGADTAPHA